MLIHGLPVVDNPGGVLVEQVRLELCHRLGAGQGASFQDRLAQTDQPFIGMDFQEQPARLNQERFQLGDFHAISF